MGNPDAVLAVGEGGRLQLGEGVEPLVQAVQLSGRLFELGVGLEQHGTCAYISSGSIIRCVFRPVSLPMLRRVKW